MPRTFLIVDDNQVDHFLIKTIVEDYGDAIELEHAYDGREALDLLKNGLSPSVILLDIVMPGLDGYGFLKEYVAANDMEQSPVVMLTSSYAEKDKEETFKYNVVRDYICKPLKGDDIGRIQKAALLQAPDKNISIE